MTVCHSEKRGWRLVLVKILVFFLLSAFWLLLTVNSAVDQLSTRDRFYITGIIGGGWLIQLILLFFVMRLAALNLVLAVFAAINLFSLYLCFVEEFFTLATSFQLLLILLALLIAYQFFTSLSAGRWWQYTVVSVAALLFIMQFGTFYQHLPRYDDRENTEQSGDSTASDSIRVVNFINTPNVYFISFDSAPPEALAKEYYQMSKLAYQTVLEKNNFHIFRNAFSDGPSTKSALNRLLAMDPAYYNRLVKENKQHDLFTGLAPAPLLQIFKANGYLTSTYSRDSYFGIVGGLYVDDYNVFISLTFCGNHLVSEARKFGFFGYCRYLNSDWGKQKALETRLDINLYADFVLEDIFDKLQSGRPLFSMVHFITPDHTPLDYNGSQEHFFNFRQAFISRSTNETAPLMQRFLEFIRENDPGAYLYFYSDHGSLLSRSLNNVEHAELEKQLQRFYIQDSYAVVSAFYPPDVCQPHFLQLPGAPYYFTNSGVARGLIRCLADGADAVSDDVQYRLWPEKNGWWGDAPAFYEDYLYE